jgi:hypothetical protein
MDTKISAPAQSNWAGTNLTESTLYASAQDTITITAALDNMNTIGPYTGIGAIGTSHPNVVWNSGTGATTTTAPWLSSNPTGTAPKITLNGEGADVEVNGWSLVAAVKRIEERLGLFQPNPELESEWEDLRDLAEQYKKLEQHIRDKQATWDRLKAMPKVDLD